MPPSQVGAAAQEGEPTPLPVHPGALWMWNVGMVHPRVEAQRRQAGCSLQGPNGHPRKDVQATFHERMTPPNKAQKAGPRRSDEPCLICIHETHNSQSRNWGRNMRSMKRHGAQVWGTGYKAGSKGSLGSFNGNRAVLAVGLPPRRVFWWGSTRWPTPPPR